MSTTPARALALDIFISAVRRRSRQFVESAVASSLINILTLVTSLFAMQVYDRVIPNSAFDTLKVLFVGVLIAVALEATLKIARVKLLDITGKAIELELSQTFFNKAMSIRMDARPNTIGTFASQIREFESVKSFLTSTTLFVIADAPFAVLFLVMIFAIGGWLGVVALVALPLTMLVGFVVQRPLAKLTHLHMRESSIKNGMLIESIDGAESIKAAGGEGWFSARWFKLSALLGDTGLQTRALANLSGTLAASIQQICYASTVVVGVFLVDQGTITVGALIASTILVSRVLTPVSQLAGMAVSWNSAKSALESLNDLVNRPSAGPDEHTTPVRMEKFSPSLRAEAVRLAYGDDKVLAIELDKLSIAPGERVAIVGASGSGKTSLLKVLSGLYKPTEGRVFYSDVDMAFLEPTTLRRQIGYLPQDTRLFNGTLRDNLVLGLQEPTDDHVMDVCKITGVDKLIARHPRGISLPIHEGGRGLSGGQRQMVALSRLLIQQPAVLLLDEPTASLDHQHEMSLIRSLKQFIRPDQTLVVVTHKLPILELVTRVIVVDQNKVVMDGPIDSVLKRGKQGGEMKPLAQIPGAQDSKHG
ncbi:MAG: ATP-binding cassette domain-containing protein [Limnobacter sp.]|uniref:ATP-binding cassette domain-containing protein n=1 Tax=Limnobacter sp. TaxID=2003368 RepID=UPI00391BD1E9